MNLRMTLGVAALLALPALGSAQEGSMSREPKMSRDSGIEIGDLIGRYAKRTGRKFIVDPRVRAVVELANLDVGQLTHDQLLAILDVHNFAAVEQGGVITVVPDAGGRQLVTPVYTDTNFKALDHEIVTLLVKTRNACAGHLVPILRPLMPQRAHMAADIQSGMLILNDSAGNVRRIADLIEKLDKATPAGRSCDFEPAVKK
jgi:general secretion pathway protein D